MYRENVSSALQKAGHLIGLIFVASGVGPSNYVLSRCARWCHLANKF